MAALAPLDVQMGDVNAQNLGQLRILNEHTFPVRYADKFYEEIPTLPEGLAKFAYCGGTDRGVPGPFFGDRTRLHLTRPGVVSLSNLSAFRSTNWLMSTQAHPDHYYCGGDAL